MLHQSEYSPCLVWNDAFRLLKYVDGLVLDNSNNKCANQDGLDEDILRLTIWSADHGLAMV